MGLLLDTHTFIWFYQGNKDLSVSAQKAINDSNGEFYISIASFWEITIKVGLEKLRLEPPLNSLFEDTVNQGYRILPIDLSHFLAYNQLSLYHRDPSDRLIIAQSIS